MILTPESYYSPESNRVYMSASQYKAFMGSMGREACPAQAAASLAGEWQEEPSTAMMVGSYVDAHFEGALPIFKGQHPEIFTKSGDLKSEYRHAEVMIQRAERDEYFMKFLTGQKQAIMTGEIGGIPWKARIDCLIPGTCIVDLKTVRSIQELSYKRGIGYMTFIDEWGYDIQGAIYQEIVRQNTGEKLPFFIAAISKDKVPDIEILYVDDEQMKGALDRVIANVPQIIAWKAGAEQPPRCEKCDYCKHTKILTKPKHYKELLGELF